jgi:hypothetical protein
MSLTHDQNASLVWITIVYSLLWIFIDDIIFSLHRRKLKLREMITQLVCGTNGLELMSANSRVWTAFSVNPAALTLGRMHFPTCFRSPFSRSSVYQILRYIFSVSKSFTLGCLFYLWKYPKTWVKLVKLICFKVMSFLLAGVWEDVCECAHRHIQA